VKQFENLSTFGEVMGKSGVPYFWLASYIIVMWTRILCITVQWSNLSWLCHGRPITECVLKCISQKNCNIIPEAIEKLLSKFSTIRFFTITYQDLSALSYKLMKFLLICVEMTKTEIHSAISSMLVAVLAFYNVKAICMRCVSRRP